MRNRVSITVPAAKEREVRHLLDVATKIAGGSTVMQAMGRWFDENATEYKETVFVHHFWYERTKRLSMLRSVSDIATALCANGEQCVMVEALTHGTFGQKTEVIFLEAGQMLTLEAA